MLHKYGLHYFTRFTFGLTILLSACAAGSANNQGAAYGPFLAAQYANTQHDEQTAITYYTQAIQADPTNQQLINEAFIAALLAGNKSAGSLAQQVQGNALATMLIGNQAAAKGDYTTALQQYSLLPSNDLSGLFAPLLIAWANLGTGNPQAALQGLLAHIGNGEAFAGINVLNAALIADQASDMKDATQLYDAAGNLASSPNLRLAQILASWQARQGNLTAATGLLAQMAATHPSLASALPALEKSVASPVINTPTDGLAETYLTIAGSLDQPSQALLRVTFLNFALALRPNLSAARLLLADIQDGDGTSTPANQVPNSQLAQALATLTPIPKSDPLYAPAALQEAGLMAALGQTAKAVTLLDGLAALTPGQTGPVEEAGDILRENSQFTQAITYYDRAIASLPNPPPETAWSLYYDRGISKDQNGNWQGAEPDLQAALKLSPNQPYVLNYLGYTWALRGQNLGKARAMLQQAASLAPGEGAIIDSLGYLNLRDGDTGKALTLLTKAVELDPDDAEVNAHLGDAFYASGQKLQADYQWQRALALKPDAKLQAEIQSKLKQFQPPA